MAVFSIKDPGRVIVLFIVTALLLIATGTESLYNYISNTFKEETTTLKIIIPAEVYNGLKGWAQIWITYPGGHKYSSAIIIKNNELSVTFKLNMSNILAKASKVLQKLSKHGLGEYASVQITLYLIKEGNGLCIKRATYTTLDYYLDKLSDYMKANKQARLNPLALLEAGSVRISSKKFSDCIYLNLTLEKASIGLNETNIRLQAKHLWSKDIHSPIQPTEVASINPNPPAEPPCPLSFTEIYFPGLYNSRYNPPPLWFSSVILDPMWFPTPDQAEKVIKDMWYIFATRFSVAYFFPAYCSDADAVISASYYTDFPEGVHTMDHVIYVLAQDAGYYNGVLGWSDEYEEGTLLAVYDAAPIMRMTLVYTGSNEPSYPLFTLGFSLFQASYEKIGLTFMGEIIVGKSEYFLDGWMEFASLSPALDWYSVAYIYAPLNIEYHFDAIVVHYVVDDVYSGGYKYKRVVPLFYYTPYYTFEYDYVQMKSHTDSYAHPTTQLTKDLNDALYDLSILADETTSYYEDWVNIYNETVNPGAYTVVLDTSKISTSEEVDLSWLMTFIANMAVSKVLTRFDSSFHRLSTMSGALVGVAMTRVNSNIILTKLEMYCSPNMPTVVVKVNKLSPMKDYISHSYEVMGAYPLLYTYQIIVEGP